MVDMRGLFGNLNNTLNNIGLSGNLGLLTTGVGLLEGQPIGQAVRSGLQTFQGLQSIDEERKRKALVQKLVSEGGFTPQEQQFLAALPSGEVASAALKIRSDKQAAANRPPSTAKGADGFLYYTSGPQRGERVLPGVTGPTPEPKTAKDADGFLRYTTGPQKGERVFADVTGPTPEPKTAKAADGFLYYTSGPQKGERVFPDAQKPPSEPIFREFDGDLYKVNAEGGLDLVQKGTKDSKFVTVNGKVFRQDGENLVEVLDESKPKAANLINLLATRDFTLDGQLIKQGEVFALDKNSQTNLIRQATNLQTGGAIIAPSAIENITSPQNNTLENVENVISETESKVSDDQFDIGTAAGGDIKGVLTDLGNAFLGFTFGVPLGAERSRQAAFINNANNQIKVPMVRALADRGAKYARDEIDKIIPQPTDSNPKFVAKIREILPDIEITISEVAKEISAEESEKGFGTALGLRGQLENLLKYKKSAEKALQNYDANNTKTQIQLDADKVLEGSK